MCRRFHNSGAAKARSPLSFRLDFGTLGSSWSADVESGWVGGCIGVCELREVGRPLRDFKVNKEI